jgi:DNA polymerase-4
MQWATPVSSVSSASGQPLIFHVDINSYFATMMQQENPTLRGKPIGILKDVGRTCIIASSNEAKKQGVKTGCSLADAKRLCPTLITVPAKFNLYLSATRHLKEVFTSLCPDVRIFSLDEAFLHLTGCETFMQQRLDNTTTLLQRETRSLPHQFGRLIQAGIKAKLGSWVQCSVGISHNHLLAKMAGEIAPKGDVFEITSANLDTVLSQVSFADVCGVGYRLGARLEALGVTTPYMINLLDDQTLETYFGPFWSQELRKIGRGEETHFFTHEQTVSHMQSVGRTITGFKLTSDEAHICRVLLNLTEEVTYKLRRMALVGRTVSVFVSGSEESWGKTIRLKRYVCHTKEVFELIYHRLYRSWTREFPIIRFGVWVGELIPARDLPLSWLPETKKLEKVSTAIDAVNNRFGLFTLRPASLLSGSLTDTRLIRPEVTGYLGDRLYHGL